MPSEIPVVFHRVPNYDYDFIIKELANEFERQFECIGESKENYKKCSVPIEKKIAKIDTDDTEAVETI